MSESETAYIVKSIKSIKNEFGNNLTGAEESILNLVEIYGDKQPGLMGSICLLMSINRLDGIRLANMYLKNPFNTLIVNAKTREGR